MKLKQGDNPHSRILVKMKKLLRTRIHQPAFHPNATQFTLQLRSEFLGFWRQSLNRRQSIFAISNVTDKPQDLTLSTINLIDNQPWYDLINGEVIDTTTPILTFSPYQSMWISNYLTN